jgi:hypothetical protein
MITEGKNYEERLVKMNFNLNKLNRYKDILPCKYLILSDEFNRVDVFGEKAVIEENKKNYINASFINVIL